MTTDALGNELTPLQECERQAMCDSRGSRATSELVDAIRRVRAAVQTLRGSRYADGECDAVALGAFFAEFTEIEGLER